MREQRQVRIDSELSDVFEKWGSIKDLSHILFL